MTIRRLLAVVSLTVLAACGAKPMTPGAPVEDDRLVKQAREALARWDAAAVGQAGKGYPFVPVGDQTGQIGDWEAAVGANNKIALMSGQVVVDGSSVAPPDGEIRWTDGSSRKVPLLPPAQALAAIRADGMGQDCGGCKPLSLTNPKLISGKIPTSRGDATVPLWQFDVAGSQVKVTRVAVSPSEGIKVVPPPWDPNNAPGGLAIEAATVDGGKLTVRFTGSPKAKSEPCGNDYTAKAVESAHAVVIIVTADPHAPNEICTMIGAPRTAEVTLAAPLGDRAVLEVQQGLPVPVTIAG